MKITKSIRDNYDALHPEYDRLKKHIDSIIKTSINESWFYCSRIKTQESFALKIETGRYETPRDIDDFLGATIAVPTTLHITEARDFLCHKFKTIKIKPTSEDSLRQNPHSFLFNDLRIYCIANEPHLGAASELIFEIQVKTFLQYAWGVATHDISYKSQAPKWGLERLTYQVKAMLEHAETAIAKAKEMAEAENICKTNHNFEEISEYIRLLKLHWAPEQLPFDMKRLAENVRRIVKRSGYTIDQVFSFIEKERQIGKGSATLNLTPYAAIVQTLFNRGGDYFQSRLEAKPHDKNDIIVIPEEVILPDNCNLTRLKSVRIIKSPQI